MGADSACTCGVWDEPSTRGSSDDVPDGVSLGGYFVLESWMFSEASPPGSSFPPAFDAEKWARTFPSPWRSEGHLTQLLAERLGPEGTLAAFARHWDTYLGLPIAEVCATLKRRRIRGLRVPVGWNMFPPAAREGFVHANGLVADPFALERTVFVACSPERLRDIVKAAAAAGLEVVVDLHSLPGETGPAGTFTPWTNALDLMTEPERERWFEAYQAIISGLVDYVAGLPQPLRSTITGLQASNDGLLMGPGGYATPSYSGRHKVSNMGLRMHDRFIRLAVRALGSECPGLYVNLQHIFLPSDERKYLETVAEWLSSQGIDPRKKLVHIRHLFLTDWGPIFQLPTAANMKRWVATAFAMDERMHPRWRRCCIEWSAAPPRSHIFFQRVRRADSSLPAVWKETLYRAFVHSFAALGIENYFWAWDMPYACSNPEVLTKHRTYWSLRCILGENASAPRRPPGVSQ